MRVVFLVCEAGHVALNPVMPSNEGGSPREPDSSVGSNQSPTRKDRVRLQNKECKREYEGGKLFSHRGFLLSDFRMFTNDDDNVDGKVPVFCAQNGIVRPAKVCNRMRTL